MQVGTSGYVHLFPVHLMILSVTLMILCRMMTVIITNELERTWKEATVYSKLLTHNLIGGTRKVHERIGQSNRTPPEVLPLQSTFSISQLQFCVCTSHSAMRAIHPALLIFLHVVAVLIPAEENRRGKPLIVQLPPASCSFRHLGLKYSHQLSAVTHP